MKLPFRRRGRFAPPRNVGLPPLSESGFRRRGIFLRLAFGGSLRSIPATHHTNGSATAVLLKIREGWLWWSAATPQDLAFGGSLRSIPATHHTNGSATAVLLKIREGWLWWSAATPQDLAFGGSLRSIPATHHTNARSETKPVSSSQFNARVTGCTSYSKTQPRCTTSRPHCSPHQSRRPRP